MKMPQKNIDKYNDVWKSLGLRSFSYFYDLTIEEVNTMAENSNDTFHIMVVEMNDYLNNYEDCMGRIRQADKSGQCNRLEILDL